MFIALSQRSINEEKVEFLGIKKWYIFARKTRGPSQCEGIQQKKVILRWNNVWICYLQVCTVFLVKHIIKSSNKWYHGEFTEWSAQLFLLLINYIEINVITISHTNIIPYIEPSKLKARSLYYFFYIEYLVLWLFGHTNIQRSYFCFSLVLSYAMPENSSATYEKKSDYGSVFCSTVRMIWR